MRPKPSDITSSKWNPLNLCKRKFYCWLDRWNKKKMNVDDDSPSQYMEFKSNEDRSNVKNGLTKIANVLINDKRNDLCRLKLWEESTRNKSMS